MHIQSAHIQGPLLHQTSLAKHRFNDIIFKIFWMVTSEHWARDKALLSKEEDHSPMKLALSVGHFWENLGKLLHRRCRVAGSFLFRVWLFFRPLVSRSDLAQFLKLNNVLWQLIEMAALMFQIVHSWVFWFIMLLQMVNSLYCLLIYLAPKNTILFCRSGFPGCCTMLFIAIIVYTFLPIVNYL